MKNYCKNCSKANFCEHAFNINFCDNCRDKPICDERFWSCYDCDGGHTIACKNGFVHEDYFYYDEED